MPPEILAAFRAAAARACGVRLDLRWFPSVPSTMDVAAQAAHAEAAEGLVIVADEQTNGRGRRGRAWSSPPGAGLYVSFVFLPQRGERDLAAGALITLAAGVAVREAIGRATGFIPELKWPNDVMVGRRKLAGILAEALRVGTEAETVILGIGINVRTASHPDAVAARATSLEAELGQAVDRALLLEEVLVAVANSYRDLRGGNTSDILRQWRAAAPCALGATIEWVTHDGRQRGTTAGIDDTGALLVRTSTGVERIIGGEVIWL